MSKLPLTFACGLYDRMLALQTGEVQVEGVDLNFLVDDNPRNIFDRMAAGLEFDASEFSSSEYVSRFVAGNCPLVAIPVFASRVFRHSFIFINKKHIKSPKDLEGKKIGVPVYTMTAAIFIRGLLSDEHGIDFSKNEWVEGDINSAKRHGNPTILPTAKKLSISANQSGKSLSKLLEEGELSAIIGTGVPEAFGKKPRHRPALSGLSRGRDGILQAHQDLPDHAHGGAAPRPAREASVRGERALHRVPAIQGRRVEEDELPRHASLHAAVDAPPSSTRSRRCSAATHGPTASSRTGRRSRRWCAISKPRASSPRRRRSTSCSSRSVNP